MSATSGRWSDATSERRLRGTSTDGFRAPRVVDVIEMQDRERGPDKVRRRQVARKGRRSSFSLSSVRRQPPHPLVEITEHDLRPVTWRSETIVARRRA